MPGNEAGDRVRNFFDQGSLSQNQRHAQLDEAKWSVLNDNIWGATEKQIGGPLSSGSKNYNVQQSDIERGQGNQFSLGPQGLKFMRSNVKSPSQLQQMSSNGFMHTSQIDHTRHNEANFLGVDTESDRHNMTPRGLSILEAQQRSGSPHTNTSSFGGSESAMNFNFVGRQQQMGGRQQGMLQSLPRQQSTSNDAQLLQQQVMLKQVQELQRQQQFPQLEAIQKSALSHVSSFPSQTAGQYSPAINGNLMHDTSNHPWSSQVMVGNTNWQQRGPPPSVQGFSNGFMITPEQGQAMRFMGMIPQQASQSLYGVPVSSSRSANPFSHSDINKPGVLQIPTPSSSFSGNQYAPFAEQASMQNGTMLSKSASEGKSSFDLATSQSLGNVVNLGSFTQVKQSKVPLPEGSGQGFAGGLEVLPEKSVTQASSEGASSQAAVALDPTEEKILFGDDENIWEAFGGAALTASGDGIDLLGGCPSVQSGSWSALMQSAVAETSSAAGGMQEEWSGLGSQNSASQPGNQRFSVFHDNETQPPIWVDSSQRVSLGARTTTNDVSSSNTNMNTNYVQDSMFRKPVSNQQRESLQPEIQIPLEGRRWLDSSQPKLHSEEKQVVENSISRDCSKTYTGFRSHQQNASLHDNSGQRANRQSGLSFTGSVPANGGVAPSNQDNLHDKDRKMQMFTDTGHDAAVRLEPVPNSYISVGSSHVNSRNDAVAPALSNMKVNLESSQNLHDNHHLDLWKSINSSAKSGLEGSGKDQHNLIKGPPILESSVNTPAGGAAEMHEAEIGDRRENFNVSQQSSLSRHPPVANVWSDAAERHGLPGGKEKSSGKRVQVTRKFQYHPMGDVDMDVEPSSAAKQVLHSQSMSQSSGPIGHEVQPRFLGLLSTNSTEMEKGRLSSFHGAVNTSHGVSSSGIHPGYLPSTSAPFVGSGEVSSPNRHMSPSQNMLELLHKVDQSNEQNDVSHVSSTDYNRLSDIPACGPVGSSQSQSSASHGFSLQLAPPSQGIAPSNLNDAAQSSSRTNDSPSSGHATHEKGDKKQAWSDSVSSAQCLLPSHQQPEMESGCLGNTNADGSLPNPNDYVSAPLPSGSPYLRNPLQSQHLTVPSAKMINDQSRTVTFNRHAFHDQQISRSQPQTLTHHSVSHSHDNLVTGRHMNQHAIGASVRQMPVSRYAVMAGMSTRDSQSPLGANLWTSQQQLLAAGACNASDLMTSQYQSNDASETSSFSFQKDWQDGPRRIDALSSQVIVSGEERLVAEAQTMVKTAGASSQEEEPSARYLLDASPSNPAANQKDIEAFHCPLKPNDTAHHSYSLLHQMQAMNSVGSDPSYRESKRLKGPDCGPDAQQMAEEVVEPFRGGVNGMVSDPSNQTSVSAGDAEMLNFSARPGTRNTSFQLPQGNLASQDMLSFGHVDPQKYATGNIGSRANHIGISPQMAPSWFEQYGTFKNGQLLPVPNVLRGPMTKSVEQQFISGKSPSNLVAHNPVQLTNAVTDTAQIANSCPTRIAYTPSEHVSSLHALDSHITSPSLVSMIPKKRKTATYDFLPWNKEIGQSLKRLQTMSSAEVDWAHSSNRLVEKVEDENDTNEDSVPMIRSKRRLILTTQLMQQVLRPPSAAVLSLDALSNYEIIVYSLARLALGDSCSLICSMESDAPADSRNLLSRMVKTSERIRDHYFSKVVEDFVSRVKEMENDLLRLDKRASILEFRLDCQDLERFSVINRFARFHGRGQVDGVENSLSSDTPMMVQKPCPQRYVSAHPMPRNVPERVQCLSL